MESKADAVQNLAVQNLAWSRDPDVMAGELVFSGTRVLVSSLFHTLSDGGTMEDFFRDFPTVPKESAYRVLDAAGELMDRATAVLSHSPSLQAA